MLPKFGQKLISYFRTYAAVKEIWPVRLLESIVRIFLITLWKSKNKFWGQRNVNLIWQINLLICPIFFVCLKQLLLLFVMSSHALSEQGQNTEKKSACFHI